MNEDRIVLLECQVQECRRYQVTKEFLQQFLDLTPVWHISAMRGDEVIATVPVDPEMRDLFMRK
jgi:hypothetical protein